MIVAIGCPIEDREWIVDRYLKSLEDIVVPTGVEKKYAFVIGDSVKDRTPDAVVNFLNRHDGALAVLKREPADGPIIRPKSYDYEYLARARNVLAALAFQGLEADKLFSIDSDIIVEPGAFCKLYDAGFDIAAAPVRNSTNPNVMNFMMFNQEDDKSSVMRFTRKGLQMPDLTQPFKVDLTGACSLIDAGACDIRYADYCGGEDTGFAMECFYEDIEQVVIPTVYTEHYMDRNDPDTPLVCAHFERRETIR